MLHLPWSSGLNSKKLLEDEVVRQLAIMQTSEPESEEYQEALKRYTMLHDHALNERKIDEHKHSRWFEGAVTGILAIGTMTYESWTPLTSKWWSSLTRPFRRRDDFRL